MARKDSEKDSERPHYYSQFWLDVAAGRRVIGAPKPEEGETAEAEISETLPPRRGRSENIVHPVAEPLETASYSNADTDFGATTGIQSDLDYPEESDIPDVELEASDEDDEEYYEEEEEEEDDEMNWGRSRKKARPTRPTKAPLKKPGKRDTRRGF